MSHAPFRKPGLLFIGSWALSGGERYWEHLRSALAGGAAAFMVREKEMGGRELLQIALTAREMTRSTGAQLIVSERLDVAIAAGADAVHLPENSFTPEEAGRVVGAGMLIGRSVHSMEGAVEAARLGANYLLAGPVFITPGKGPLLPIDALISMRADLSLDVIPVGGINGANIGQIARGGFDSAAVIRAVASADDPQERTAELVSALQSP